MAMWLLNQNLSYIVLTLITRAPSWASTCVPNGPATASPRSSTVIPSSAAEMARPGGAAAGAGIPAASSASASARTSAV